MIYKQMVLFFRYSLKCTDHCFNVALGNKRRATLGNPTAVNMDGLLVDVDVQSIDNSPLTHEDKQKDTDHFFCIAVTKNVNRKSKKYHACKLCP